jgi:hypothetical protein
MKLEFSRQVFIMFHENLSSGSELFDAGRRTDGQTAMTKLIVAFRNFVNAPKIEKIIKSNCWLRAPLHNFDKPYIA